MVNVAFNVCLNKDMIDPNDAPPPLQGGFQTQLPTQKKGRRATRLRDLIVSRSADQRLSIEFDMNTGKVLGEHSTKFTSYVALLDISKVSILIDD